MKDNAIDVEVVPVEIVRCPRCGARNRLLKQERHVGYRCGGCWGPLANPFERISIVKRCFQAIAPRNPRRGIGGIIGAFLVALIVVAIVTHQNKPPASSGIDLIPTIPPQPVVSHSKPWIPVASPPTDPVVFPPAQSRTIPPIDIMPTPRPMERPTTPPKSLENGTILLDVINAGHSEFTVDNGTDRDAVIKLIDSGKRQTVVAFYVRAQESVTADLIPEGTFTVLCGQGVDWDDAVNFFKRKRSFQKFEPDMDFTMKLVQTRDQIIHQYKHNSLQLQPSITGEMKESDISETTFMQYDGGN